jgi:hypothetical protein
MNKIAENRLTRNQVNFIIHLIVISMLFILPEFLLNFSDDNPEKEIHWGIYVKSAIYICVFYINYYFILAKTFTLGKRQIITFLAYNLVVIFVALCVSYATWRLLDTHQMLEMASDHPGPGPGPGPHGPHPREMGESHHFIVALSFILRDFVMIVLTIALSFTLKVSNQWAQFERNHQQLVATQREDELKSLKSQLNPHFLFNTLNSIYVLITISPEKAQEAVHELSRMLRYVLYQNASMVTLSQEIDFARGYINLMKLRLSQTPLDIKLEANGQDNAMVPPLIFICLLENAFKHGNTGNAEQPIELHIVADEEKVVCRTHNYISASTSTDKQGGIGIANLKRRIQLLYSEKASLEVENDGVTYTSVLTIPFNSQT